MKNYLIAERYAKALLRSIEDDASLDAVGEALFDLGQLIQNEHDVHNVLTNPALDVSKREAVLSDLTREAGVPDCVARLSNVLLHRGRIVLLADVAEIFHAQADERLNRVTAHVRTAAPMQDAQRERLAAVLERFAQKSVRMDCQVDPKMLGGVIARMGSVVMDGRVRTRLERLRKTLLTRQ